MVFIVQRCADHHSYAEVIGVFEYFDTALLNASIATRLDPLDSFEVHEFQVNTENHSRFIKPNADKSKLLTKNDILPSPYLDQILEYERPEREKQQLENEHIRLLSGDVESLIAKYNQDVVALKQKELQTNEKYTIWVQRVDLDTALQQDLHTICLKHGIMSTAPYITNYVESLKSV